MKIQVQYERNDIEMINILFVDDEPNILDGLQRMLRSMRREWQMSFAGGGMDALGHRDEENFHNSV